MKTKKAFVSIYTSLFLVTFMTIVMELLLTRIFSVVAWYHFAFMAISIALFGMTAGAVYTYLKPKKFSQENIKKSLYKYTIYFALSILSLILLFIAVPFIPGISIQNLVSMVVTFGAISIPFFFSGVIVCVLLTKFLEKISVLYFFDLVGAGFGCFLFIPLMDNLDPMSLILILAAIAFIASLILKPATVSKKHIFFISFFIIFLLTTAFFNIQDNFFRITWIRGNIEQKPQYEKWNAFSRVIVKPYTDIPFGWGLSNEYLKLNKRVKQKLLVIDSSAGTVLTYFGNNLKKLEHLKWDVTNFVHYLRSKSKVAIIGVGGGRDVLSALVFKQKEIVGIEINHDILYTLTHKYREFTGNLEEYSNIKLIKDEARSYIARQKEKYDIIQSTLVDTYAASSSGAFALTENSLYTIEAWNTFLDHLTDSGILTFSRWWRSDLDGEMIRLTSLAISTLESREIKDIQKHIILVRGKNTGTILISKKEFSEQDEEIISEISKKMGFQYVLGPTQKKIETYYNLLNKNLREEMGKTLPITIKPPTDNNPFFFQILKFSHILSANKAKKYETNSNIIAIVVLFTCLVIVTLFSFATIILPLRFTIKAVNIDKKNIQWGIIFFATIGLAFMLIEISQLNLLAIFLGHPTYGLSTVLFSLLISSGIGSFTTRRIHISKNNSKTIKRLTIIMASLVGVTFLYAIISPYIWNLFRASATPIRIAVSVIMLSFIGFFMGMAFPLGMKVANLSKNSPTPWFWGINGAMSVLSSVLAIAFCIMLGISFTLFLGIIFYIFAGISLIKFSKTIA